jgi:hypothetical protein
MLLVDYQRACHREAGYTSEPGLQRASSSTANAAHKVIEEHFHRNLIQLRGGRTCRERRRTAVRGIRLSGRFWNSVMMWTGIVDPLQ